MRREVATSKRQYFLEVYILSQARSPLEDWRHDNKLFQELLVLPKMSILLCIAMMFEEKERCLTCSYRYIPSYMLNILLEKYLSRYVGMYSVS